MADKKDYIGFTLDPKRIGNVFAQDPQTLREMIEGIQEARSTPLPLTTQLGAANLTSGEGQEPTWCSVFVATVQGKKSGDADLFYRNNTRGGKGDRVQMRLRRQPKRDAEHAASASPGAVLPVDVGGMDPGVIAAITQAVVASLANANSAPAPTAGAELPSDIREIVAF